MPDSSVSGSLITCTVPTAGHDVEQGTQHADAVPLLDGGAGSSGVSSALVAARSRHRGRQADGDEPDSPASLPQNSTQSAWQPHSPERSVASNVSIFGRYLT